MQHKKALQRFKSRQREVDRRELRKLLVYGSVPSLHIEHKETKQVSAYFGIGSEELLRIGDEYAQHIADRHIAEELGYELLKHAKIEHRADKYGSRWIATIEVVE